MEHKIEDLISGYLELLTRFDDTLSVMEVLLICDEIQSLHHIKELTEASEKRFSYYEKKLLGE